MPRRNTVAQSKPEKVELLTRQQAAEYLGVSVQTLAIWKTTGRYELPVVKVGRLARYRRSELDLFLERRTVESTASRAMPNRQILADRALATADKVRQEQRSVEFAEVQVVDRRDHNQQARKHQLTKLEVVLPSGITVRLDAGCSLDLLSSIIARLENP